MRIAHLQACVLEWPPRLHGDPQGSSPLQARHPRVVGLRMPLAQFGVRVDDLRVLHQPVAEVVDDGGDGEDAAETFIKSRFCHDSALLWVYLLAMASGSLSGRSRQLSVTVSRSGHLVAPLACRCGAQPHSARPNSHRPVDSQTGQSWGKTNGRLRSAYWGPAAAGAAGSTCSSCSREVMLSFV